jgi:hypothetical protein
MNKYNLRTKDNLTYQMGNNHSGNNVPPGLIQYKISTNDILSAGDCRPPCDPPALVGSLQREGSQGNRRFPAAYDIDITYIVYY